MIRENLANVLNAIKEAETESGLGNKVTLVAVSKTHPVEMIKEAYDAGQRDFGENKVQELMEKTDKLPGDIRWHLIGHLQRNKVKYIVDKVYMIHSVDSLELAREIEKQAAKKDVRVKILIQVNISHEESKFGINPDELAALYEEIKALPHIEFCGLMTIAPICENPEDTRPVFEGLRNLSIDFEGRNRDNKQGMILSMGMSSDYLVAINCGSTMVRVGTSIFGARNYNL